jgi:SpoVK/Ycf46/Vps4 family AAA+-type ATPase
MINFTNSTNGTEPKESDQFADKDESTLLDEIDDAKETIRDSDIEDSQAQMVRLAADISDMYGELADRQGEDPAGEQYEKKATRWQQVARLLVDGTDPTEEVQSGTGDTDMDVDQFRTGTPKLTFDDVGGYEDVKEFLEESGIKPAQYRDFLQGQLDVSIMNGVVFSGPPGTGKTRMAKAFAGEFDERLDDDITVFRVPPNALKRGIRGESSDLLRALFTAAQNEQPAVIIFEEIDTLIQDRQASNLQKMQSDRDLVNSFLEEINQIDAEEVTCLGTTNRSDALDEAATRSGRLKDVEMSLPGVVARMRIFHIHLEKRSEYYDRQDIDREDLAQKSKGLSGADIARAVEEAFKRMGIEYKEDERARPRLTQDDLLTQLEALQDE